MSNGDTTRELLLQLNDKLAEFMADSKADRAAINVKLDQVAESVKVLNHNSTILANRVTGLEAKVTTAEEQKKAIKDLLNTQRNWIVGALGVVVSILTILSLLHLI
jgi:uncharacterized protein YlxW (UPF0749 family)